MIDRIPKGAFLLAAGLFSLALAYVAYTRPGYFTSQTYLAGLLFLELLIGAVWMYRRFFFPVLLVAFLFAGVNLPVGRGWTAARWAVLGVGAAVGILIVVKERVYPLGLFHVLAFFSVLMGLISAAVSAYPETALLKVLSILLLFAYAATGARIAAHGREKQFVGGLVLGCEILVGLNAIFYAVGIQAMGNPNSLGAIIGMFGSPILLWSVLVGGERRVYHRRLFLYSLSIYLVFLSHARAGIAAALFSSAVICLALKKYKLLFEGSILLVIVVAAVALVHPEALSSATSSVVYKNKEEGILASRVSPWQAALDNFYDHPWFGMGLGTTLNGEESPEEQSAFASSGKVTAENGSSYLALLVGVGALGAVPFAILLAVLIAKVGRTLIYMHRSANPMHSAIPLTAVIIAGLLHALFEDWMFAPGNYLCVCFWSLAFVLSDFCPPSARSGFEFRLHAHRSHPVTAGIAPLP